MSTALIPQTLDAGLAAIQLASHDGVRLRITHIALGDAGYTPDAGQTGLRHELARYPIADGQTVGPRQLHLTALADDSAEFWVREVGFVLENGAFLAVWSDPAYALAYKQANLELLLAYDLALSGVPADSVIVQSTGAGLNLYLAEQLAALATAEIDGMQADLQQDAQLAGVGQQLSGLRSSLDDLNAFAARGLSQHDVRLAGIDQGQRQQDATLATHTAQLSDAATQQAAQHASLLEIQAANAAAILDLQNHTVKGVMA